MSDAPERIWAYYDRAGYTFTALGALPSYFGNVEYIRADLTADRIEELERERDAAKNQRARLIADIVGAFGRDFTRTDIPAEVKRIIAERDRLAARLREAEDKIEGLEADLDSAVEVAYRRGATEWVRLNYPAIFARLEENPARAALAAQGET